MNSKRCNAMLIWGAITFQGEIHRAKIIYCCLFVKLGIENKRENHSCKKCQSTFYLLLSRQICNVLFAHWPKKGCHTVKWIYKYWHSSRQYYNNTHKHDRFSFNVLNYSNDFNWLRKLPYRISLFKKCPSQYHSFSNYGITKDNTKSLL